MEEKKTADPSSGIGETLKKTWGLFAQNWQFLAIVWLIGLAISAILAVLIMIFAGTLIASLAGSYQATNPTALFIGGGLSVISTLILLGLGIFSIFLGSWISGAYVYAVYHVMQAKQIGAWECFQLAWKKIWTFFGLGIVGGLMVGIGFLLLIIPGVIFAILLFFAFYLIVAENLGTFGAISRSFSLASKKWLEIFVVILIIGVVAGLLSYIPVINWIVVTIDTIFMLLASGVMYKQLK